MCVCEWLVGERATKSSHSAVVRAAPPQEHLAGRQTLTCLTVIC